MERKDFDELDERYVLKTENTRELCELRLVLEGLKKDLSAIKYCLAAVAAASITTVVKLVAEALLK